MMNTTANAAAIAIATFTPPINTLTTTISGWATVNAPPTGGITSENGSVKIIAMGQDAVIRTEHGDIRLDVLFDMVQRSQDILCRIKADVERMEEYPALQAAYDHYKVIDRLCQEDPTKGT